MATVGVMGSGGARHARLAEPLGRALARMGVHLLTGGGRGVMEAVSKAFHEVPGRKGLVIGVLPAGDASSGHAHVARGPADAASPAGHAIPGPAEAGSPPSHADAAPVPGNADSPSGCVGPGTPPPGGDPGTPPGYPNPWVELAIRTHLDSRGDDGSGIRSRNHINILSSDVVIALPGSAGTASEVELAIRYGRPLILLGDIARARDLPVPVPAVRSAEEAAELARRILEEAREAW